MTLKEKLQNTNFEKLFSKLGYAFFTNGDYNLNIIGVRNMDSPIQRDKFNDYFVIMYKVNGVWHKDICECTTDPGLKLLRAPINSAGCAILVPGQYRSTWAIDYHNGKYKALCQRLKPVKVYRDKNRDNKLDFDPKTIQSGMFGINIHRAAAGYVLESVGGYSAGCQVFQDPKKFDKFMELANISSKKFGNSFTYTLLTSDQI